LSAISISTNGILSAIGLDYNKIRPTTLSISSKGAPKTWKAYTLDAFFPLFRIQATGAKISEIRNFISGIRTDNYIVIAELSDVTLLCMSRAKKGEAPYILPIRTTDEYERILNVLKKHNFRTDELSAHVAIYSCIELLKSGAEKHFINRGLFSSYFLRERLDKALSLRKRNVEKESVMFFSKFTSGIPSTYEDVPSVLSALGYSLLKGETYQLITKQGIINAGAIVVQDENLDVRSNHDNPVPSIQAVAALTKYPWVILTNGRIWRLYSSRVSSASTNYFEIDVDDITDEKHPKLKYFISLFGSQALVTGQDEISDLDFIYNGGLSYAKELEDDIRRKVFERQLFLDLVRGIISHSKTKKYSESQLQDAKRSALKLLYRILFILYAESRSLLPVSHSKYKEISLSSLRERLDSMEKEPDSTQTWNVLLTLFRSISNGSAEANIPQYNGALFEIDESLDYLKIENKYLVSALKELTLIEGKGIDYQNFGVRQLGSLYESLLDYTVRQAINDLVIINDEILDFSFVSDLKSKPSRVIEKGDLYLSVGGLARKGTGSYYTPEKIVKFLVQKGLEPIFQDREKKFVDAIRKWRRTKSKADAELSTKQLLDIQVVDPAMGSGHFLVVTVDEITKWIMSVLQRYPDSPLALDIGTDRLKILSEQNKRGIRLDEELLSFNVILKRKVMKRCVFGVDVNPLAVELAKLSLWLDSFTIGTPLTFLDHHIRSGNSLIGLWIESLKTTKSGNLSLDVWTDDVESMGNTLYQISLPADLTLSEFKRNKESYTEFREKSKALRVMLDMATAGIINRNLQENQPKNLSLIEETIRRNKLKNFDWSKPILDSISYSKRYNFFHWELEFPDAYSDERRGFDLVVMNPPWDAVKPNDDDFFSQFDVQFRKIGNKQDKNKVKKKLLSEKEVNEKYEKYLQEIQDKVAFYKNSGQFVKRGAGDTDSWKLFLERASNLLTDKGTLSIIIPSGIFTNDGGQELRNEILQNKIRYLYEFENKYGIFPAVHRSYKFVLLVADKAKPTDFFPAAFYLHSIDSLINKKEKEKFMNLSLDLIRLTSPTSLIIPELRTEKELHIFEKLYRIHPLVSQGIHKGKWTFGFVTEMHRTASSHLFKPNGKGWPLFEGKNFHQFIPDYEPNVFSVMREDGLKWTSRNRQYGELNSQIHELPRLCYREVASSTNVRSAIACVLPNHSFATHKVIIILPKFNNKLILNQEYYKIVSYMAGLVNSFVFDFLVRRKIDKTLSIFLIKQIPIPENIENSISTEIIKISARLSSSNENFGLLANATGNKVSILTMSERIELTARLNALVAHHYQIDKDEYMYIISSFTGFEEDDNLENMTQIKWGDRLIRKFNGEVRKRTLKYYDTISEKVRGVN
jgi:hypothetical protein